MEQAFKVLWLVTLAGICFAVPRPAPGRVQKRAWLKVTLLVEVPVFGLWLVTLAGICLQFRARRLFTFQKDVSGRESCY